MKTLKLGNKMKTVDISNPVRKQRKSGTLIEAKR